ncbi:putative T7SS-secreted protein [Streptomyces sp. NPDC046821]|uniref:putative T7SS-secreted protein n=1 Tax=Streptomyces sp. NPDC046821 TaxID=3154702 RepID=UPI003402DC42
MAPTLGWTDDPKDLIPGEAGKLGELETAFKGWSDKFEKIGDGLRDVRIKGWVGQASDAFWPTLAKEKKNWYYASDAMSSAAKAVHSYASTLTWAQGQAGTAIDKWKADDHEGAESVLKGAKDTLKEETEKLVKKLHALAGDSKDSPDWLVAIRNGVDTKKWLEDHGVGKAAIAPETWAREKKRWSGSRTNPRHTDKEWGRNEDGSWYFRDKQPVSTDAADDATTSAKKKPEVSIKIAEWSDKASVWSEGVDHDGKLGDAKYKYAAGVQALGVDGSAGMSVTDGRFKAGVSGTAYLAQASASGSMEYGVLGTSGEAKAFVGADASVEATVGKDGVHAGAEAFAGAKATGSASADIAGVGAGVNGEAWAGVGAEAHADIGMKDGKFTIGGDVGVGLGLGGKVGFNFTVDPHKVTDALSDGADAVGDAWDSTVGSWF